jgi:hypothetical protein
LGRSFEVDSHWRHRSARVEVDLDGDRIRIYRLRRREPQDQPLVRELEHRIKRRRFSEWRGDHARSNSRTGRYDHSMTDRDQVALATVASFK